MGKLTMFFKKAPKWGKIGMVLLVLVGIWITIKELAQVYVKIIRLPTDFYFSPYTDLYGAAISPDYSKIAVISGDLGEKKWFLNVFSLDGKRIVNNLRLPITDIPIALPPASMMEWAPDSRKILIKAADLKRGKKKGYHLYTFVVVDIEKGILHVINDVFAGCISQSWDKGSSAFLIVRYLKKDSISLDIFHLNGKEERLLKREGKNAPYLLNGMWDIESGVIYFWESGKGIYKIVQPHYRLEKVKDLPPLIPSKTPLYSWFHPLTGKLAYLTDPDKYYWRINLFDITENKIVKSTDIDWGVFPLLFSPDGRALFTTEEVGIPIIWDIKHGKKRHLSLWFVGEPLRFEDDPVLDFRWGDRGREGYLLIPRYTGLVYKWGRKIAEYGELLLRRYHFFWR